MNNKFRSIIAFLLVIILALSIYTSFPVSVNAAEVDLETTATTSGTTGDCTWTLVDGTLTISGNGAMGGGSSSWGNSIINVVIEQGVTQIGNYAFSECKSLNSVSICNSVTSIGYRAFYGCTELENVNISNIADWCKISFPDEEANPLYYAHNLYLNDNRITNLIIPNTVTDIGRLAFAGYTGLKSVTLPDNLSDIAYGVFYNCTGLTSIIIPNSVKSIGKNAFCRCTGLTSVTIGDKVAWIGQGAFYGCKGINDVLIPNSVTGIGENAFLGCTGLTSVSIPDSVISIGNGAFESCSSLKSVTIGNGVISIGINAFNSSGLTSITFSDSVTNIGHQAFWFTPWFNNQPDGLVYTGKVAYKFKGTMPEKMSLAIKNGTKGIAGRAFSECTGLNTITIPKTLAIVKEKAFYQCDSLSEVYYEGSQDDWNKISFESGNEPLKNAIIHFAESDPPITETDISIFSDAPSFSVNLGKTITIGASVFDNKSQAYNMSGISFGVENNNVLSLMKITSQNDVRYAVFNAKSVGTTQVYFSDSVTGKTKEVYVSVFDNDDLSYNVEKVPEIELNEFFSKSIVNFYNINGITIENYKAKTSKAKLGSYEVSFDAYNTSSLYGVVEVYNAEGVIVDAAVIDKNKTAADSIKECVWDYGKYIIENTTHGYWFTHRQKGYAKKSSIDPIIIPRGGYIKITNDVQSSPIACFINMTDILMQTADLAKSISGYPEVDFDFAKKLTSKMVKDVVFKEMREHPAGFVKELLENVSNECAFSKQAVGDFGTTFIKNIDDLNWYDIIFDTALSYGFSLGETAFYAFSGPVGMIMKGMFGFNDLSNIIVEIKQFINSYGSNYVSIDNYYDGILRSEEVYIKTQTIQRNISFRRYIIQLSDEDYRDFIDIYPQYEQSCKNAITYDFRYIENGKSAQPDSPVDVFIPIPEEWNLAWITTFKVYRLENSGTFTELTTRQEGNMITFTTDHFSKYLLIPVYSVTVLGDVNGDGNVDNVDATILQRHIVNMIVPYSKESLMNGDIDGDGVLTIVDVTFIQRFCVNVKTPYIIGKSKDVDSITLNKTSVSLYAGDIYQLTATISPADAADKTVNWTSSSTGIATVSSSGLVTAISVGKTVITATSSNGKKATCTVTVKPKDVDSVTLNKTGISLYSGDTYQLSATISPADAADKTVNWTSSSTDIATVSSNGLVTAKSVGNAVITATTANGKKATCTVVVKPKDVDSVTLNKTGISLYSGDTYQLSATISPFDANDKTVNWTSSSTDIATVSSNGLVTAKSVGNAVITATTANGKKATCTVVVKPKDVDSVTLNKTGISLYSGDTYQLSATISPSDANDKTVNWTSSSTGIATVSSNGLVTAKSVGNAVITATTSNGKKATCIVSVIRRLPQKVLLNKDTESIDIGQSYQLSGSVEPAEADQQLTWTTSDADVVTVSPTGYITGVKSGRAIITARASNGLSETCEVEVYQPISGYMALLLFTKNEPNGCARITKDFTVNLLSNDTDITAFNGVINGDFHTITYNYEYKTKDIAGDCYRALIPKTDGALIKNITVSGNVDHDFYPTASNKSYCAGIVAYAKNTTFENCSNQAKIDNAITGNSSGYAYAGGITAWGENCIFKDCKNSGNIMTVSMPSNVSTSIAGGIVGVINVGSIERCISTGGVGTHATNSSSLYYTTACSGGIVGQSYSATIYSCSSTGSINANSWPEQETQYTSVAATGGIVGAGNASILNSNSTCILRSSGIRGSENYSNEMIGYEFS